MLKVLVILVVLVSPVFGAEIDDALSFLRDKTPPEVYAKFSRKDISVSPCVVEHGGNVYSLSAVKVRRDKSPNMQRSLNVSAVRQASLRAAENLAKYLDAGKTDTRNFRNRDAVNHILLGHYEVRAGFNSAGKIVNDTAFGLVWSRKVNAPMSGKAFGEEYNRFLYDEAQVLFSSGRYSEAVSRFRDVNYLEWRNVDAYLGAAVCLLAAGDDEGAGELAAEVVGVFSPDMKADDMAAAGRVLFSAGRKDEGFEVLEHAYNMKK